MPHLQGVSVPIATPHNKFEFCSAWMWNYGGDSNNAERVWRTEIQKGT